MAAPHSAGALAGYRSATYDDAVAPDGSVRPPARAVMDAVLTHDGAALGAAVRAEVDALGIRFGSVDGDDHWHLDPVPRVIAAADWARLEAGLAGACSCRRTTCARRAGSATGRLVVLTDGPENSAYWEHRSIAEQLGAAPVEPGDLELRDGRLRHDGAVVDTVYRRTNADRIDSEVGELLHPVLVAGAVRVVNCFGTGIADDKLAHAYVPEMIRFYLAEDPLIDQVETFDLGEPETLAPTRRRCARRSARRPATTWPSGSSRSPRTRPRSTVRSCPATSTCDPSC